MKREDLKVLQHSDKQKRIHNYKNYKREVCLRRYRVRVKRMIWVMGAIIFLFCAMLFGSVFVSAHEGQSTAGADKYYKSINISSGDTLWSIADRYASSEYESKEAYIDEVLQINQMTSTDLYADQKLIIPYYDYEDTHSCDYNEIYGENCYSVSANQ